MSTLQHTGGAPARDEETDELIVSVVIPCLNEAENIEACVKSALETLETSGITGKVLVADNAAEDGATKPAEAAGARVIHEPRRGYGSAYLSLFRAACG